MTCDTEFGIGPNPLSDVPLWVIPDDTSWAGALVLTEGGVPVAWSVAPVLVLPTFTVTATLTADAETSTTDAQANWVMTAEQIETLNEYDEFRVTVAGETWLGGSVRWRP